MHVNRRLWLVYQQSAPQQQAVASLVSELERWDLLADDVRAWRRFGAEVVIELLLYGYCVYKLHRGAPLVLSGRDVELVFRKGKFAPRLIDHPPPGPRLGWQLIVAEPPRVDVSGRYVEPSSAAHRCFKQAVERLVIEGNLVARDTVNSVPTVYTKVANNVVASAGSSRPWFTHGNPLAADVSQRVDLDQLMRHRSETIAALDRITDTALRRTPSAPLGEAPSDATTEHRELAVSDGREMTEAHMLEQHTVIAHHTIDRLSHEIQFAFGVPPQVQGRNINSERMASSNRLNEQAITHFRATARRFKAHLEVVFAVIGGAKYGDRADSHLLDQIGHLLKPARLIKLYALAYDLDESDFDRERVKAATEVESKKQKTDETKLSATLKRTPADG